MRYLKGREAGPRPLEGLLEVQRTTCGRCEADSRSSSAARSWSILQCLPLSTLQARETATHDRAHGAERIRDVSMSALLKACVKSGAPHVSGACFAAVRSVPDPAPLFRCWRLLPALIMQYTIFGALLSVALMKPHLQLAVP